MSVIDGHYRHGLRRLVARKTGERGRTATPLELLFDLTFVAAFSVAGEQLAHGIVAGHWVAAAVSFAFAMLTIVWAWINVSWFASAFDNDDWLYRLLTMVQMIGVIVMAIGLPSLFASIERGEVLDNRLMVAGYVVIRLALVAQWVRAVRSEPRYRTVAVTYAMFVGGAQVGWVVVAALPLTAITVLFAAVVLLAVEIAGPMVAERRGVRAGSPTPWHPHHLAERFSLLAIIAIGETVFGTLASAGEISARQGWTADAVVVVAAGIALSFALWWTYFLVPHALVLETRRDKVLLWGYGHVFLYAAIAAVGTGLHVVGYLHDEHYTLVPAAAVASIAVPVLVFLVVRLLLQCWLMSAWPVRSVVQVAAIALCALAMVLVALGVPVWGCLLVVLAAPVSIVLSFELGGWRALDAQLARVSGSSPAR